MQLRRFSLVAGLYALTLGAGAPAEAGELTSPYTDPRYFSEIPFGSHSHWVQPWRAYLETVPASTFIDAIGINLGVQKDPVVQMLAKYGVSNARVEIGWNNIDYDDESKVGNAEDYERVLKSCKRWKIRPLILLNAHQGVPGPTRFYERKTTAAAAAGAREVTLDDVSGLVVGRSGLSNLTDYWAAEAIITAINGNTVTLSKPLPKAIAQGATVVLATLKYRPFSPPGSTDYQETIAAWQRYAGTVADFTAKALGTTGKSDLGFDMEIWNEMSFASNFLYVNAYYDPPFADYEQDSVWGNVVKATAEYAEAHPEKFKGVAFGDGFGNTLPWPASSEEPARISAISKHPYAGVRSYPADEQGSKKLDAKRQETTWVPTYKVLFPEYFATALQTETIIREMGPITSDIIGTEHGRNARPSGPVTTWITEVNISPEEVGVTDANKALELKAKSAARYFAFYIGKGVTKLQLFSADTGDKGLGIVKDNFFAYLEKNEGYPADDTPYISPTLRVTANMVAKMKERLDPTLTKTRPLTVESLADTHDHRQFEGDGSDRHPPLYNREAFTFLPYQVNASRFVIAYYVMTRDIRNALPPEEYTVRIGGLDGTKAAISAYDPIGDKSVPVQMLEKSAKQVTLKLTATDYPYLLTFDEAPAPDAANTNDDPDSGCSCHSTEEPAHGFPTFALALLSMGMIGVRRLGRQRASAS